MTDETLAHDLGGRETEARLRADLTTLNPKTEARQTRTGRPTSPSVAQQQEPEGEERDPRAAAPRWTTMRWDGTAMRNLFRVTWSTEREALVVVLEAS